MSPSEPFIGDTDQDSKPEQGLDERESTSKSCPSIYPKTVSGKIKQSNGCREESL